MKRIYKKRYCTYFVFVCLAVFIYVATIQTIEVTAKTIDSYVKNELILMFEQDTDYSEVVTLIHTLSPDSEILEHYDNYVLLSLHENSNYEEIMNDYNNSPSILCAEPNYIINPCSLTDDTYSSSQWGLNNTGSYISHLKDSVNTVASQKGTDLNISKAWDIYNSHSKDLYEVIVAIIDTGIDINHEDLDGNVWVNKKEIANDGIDNDNNGYVDDIHGWDFYNNDNTVCHYTYDKEDDSYYSDPEDCDDHGTHCAGIIGAVANNEIGIAGVASNVDVKLMSLKIEGGSDGSGSISAAIKAIKYATNMGAKVCNISWGSGTYSAALEEAIKESSMLFVAAAGNLGTNNNSKPIYPASYNLDNVISVTFINANGKLCNLSNYGSRTVDLAAPGYDILSTTVGNTYSTMSGSSMAVPHVTGIAAMLYAYSKNLYPANVKEVIINNLTYLTNLDGKIKNPGIPDITTIVQSVSSLKTDTKAPTISCSTSFSGNEIIVNVDAQDFGSSKLRVVKYLYGEKTKKSFQHGNLGNSILNDSFAIQKAGYYTLYASDYAGNEVCYTYNVKDDTTAPTVVTSYKVSNDYKTKTVTAKIFDNKSGVKTVKYAIGKQNTSAFKSSKTGTIITSDDDTYKFKTKDTGIYTIYALDYRGNSCVHYVHIEVIPSKTLSLSTTGKKLKVGSTYSIPTSVSPSNSTDVISFKSSDSKICEVSSKGKVTALKKGTATITIKTSSGLKKTFKITVT